jgi:hypothetical protein
MRPLAVKGDGHGGSDPRVGSRDEHALAAEAAGPDVVLFTVIGERVEATIEPRFRLVLGKWTDL